MTSMKGLSAPSTNLQMTPSRAVLSNTPEKQDAIQRDLGNLENWVHGNLMVKQDQVQGDAPGLRQLQI